LSDEPVKTYSFKLPANETVETIFVRLPGGKLVPRHIDEVVKRPTPPAPASSSSSGR